MTNPELKRAAQAIKEADACVFTSGAGMGVDSGLPDFRGNEGFWKAYPPFRQLGVSFVDMANPQWFEHDPHLAWGFYGHRLNLYRRTVPHGGFYILLTWGKQKPGGYFVFTSNVDGQFQKAGFDDQRIEECHGSIHHFQCADNCSTLIWPTEDEITVDERVMKAQDPLPLCPSCAGMARPNILMFGDWGWNSMRNGEQSSRFADWLQAAASGRLAVIECGAGTAVPTVRHTSESIVQRFNATLIRINVREPEVPAGQIGVSMGAEAALTAIDRLIRSPS